MHISELVFNKKKIFYFLLVAIVIGGIFSFLKLSKLEDPEITVMIAKVVTVYPGASAHDVELKVTSVLEEEIADLADLAEVTSKSQANVSIITVQLKMDVPQDEIPQRWDFLQKKINAAIPKLPDGAQTPMIYDDMGDVYGMFFAMHADDGFTYEEMNKYADFIERNMLEVEGVRKVSVYGKQTPEIQIIISPDKLSETGIMPMQIFMALGDYTGELYSGSIISGEEQLRVSVDGKLTSVEDVQNIIINSIGGSSFKLGDIADISMDYNESLRNSMYINNHKAIGIGLSMESGENIIEVGKRVDAKMSEINGQIPNGISFEKVFYQPDKVDDAIDGFMINLAVSVAIVIIVLMFTMGFRGGAIIGVGLVLTILATFPFLLIADGTLQRISLGAFIVAMGMLVDNAIVVLDGILLRRRITRGKSAFTKTAKQTAIPLLGATAIAIAAFLPVYLSPDTAGTFVNDLFLVLAISLAISWILALTLVPLLSAIVYKKDKVKKNASEKDIYQKPLYRGVKRVLEFGLRHRIASLVVVLFLLVITALSFPKLDKTFFPDFKYNQCYIEFTMPYGSTPEMVNENLNDISEHFNTIDGVEMVVTSHGMTPMRYCLVRGMMTENADNYGELIINFEDFGTMKKLRPELEKYLRSNYPEAISRIRNYSLSVKASHSIEAEFSGPDPAVLKDLSKQSEQIMLQNQHIDHYTICNDWNPRSKSITAIYDPLAGNRTSVSRSDISNAILAATDGLPISQVYNGEVAYPVKYMVRDKDGNRIEDLSDIPVWPTIPNIGGAITSDNIMGLYLGSTSPDEFLKENLTSVPLSSVTKSVELDWEEPVVRRKNGLRVIQAQCEPLEGFSPAQVQNELNKAISQIDMPEGYSFRWVGASELQREGLQGILSYLPIAGGIILLILLLLFNDFRKPLIVILCLPLAVIGIIPGLIITGQPFTFIAIVGVVGLCGMIIKNAIVLLDEINIRTKEYSSPYQAVVDATISRVRPVVMASLTTILGMIPLLTDPMYASMAVAIIAGLLVGTIITLIFVPILYSIFFRVKAVKIVKAIV